jgi:hypothetical protein
MIAEPITSTDVFLWALYELGGADDFVDVEDVLLKAFRLAPQRFSWRTRQDLPDRLKGNMALHGADIRSPKLLIKSGPDKRRLTVEGQEWIEENFDRLASALSGSSVVEAPKSHRSSRLVNDAARSEIFVSWTETNALPSEKWRFADLLRCSPDSAQSVWRQRVETLKSAAYAAGRDDLLKFIEQLISEHSEWF